MNSKLKKLENQVDVAPNERASIRQLTSEALGTAFLLCAVVGSGIMGERLSNGNIAIALLANSIATGCALIVLILIFAPLSGAHFNPLVTFSAVLNRKISFSKAILYTTAQISGAFVGVWIAHTMFGHPIWTFSTHVRAGWAQCFSELIATFGLMAVIHGCKRYGTPITAVAIGSYITSAYWFTASTSFANPVVTLARTITDTFSGIRSVDVLPFILAQILGAFLAIILFSWLDNIPLNERIS